MSYIKRFDYDDDSSSTSMEEEEENLPYSTRISHGIGNICYSKIDDCVMSILDRCCHRRNATVQYEEDESDDQTSSTCRIRNIDDSLDLDDYSEFDLSDTNYNEGNAISCKDLIGDTLVYLYTLVDVSFCTHFTKGRYYPKQKLSHDFDSKTCTSSKKDSVPSQEIRLQSFPGHVQMKSDIATPTHEKADSTKNFGISRKSQQTTVTPTLTETFLPGKRLQKAEKYRRMFKIALVTVLSSIFRRVRKMQHYLTSTGIHPDVLCDEAVMTTLPYEKVSNRGSHRSRFHLSHLTKLGHASLNDTDE